MDGKIIIGTEIDNSKFEKQLQDLERKKEAQALNIEIKSKNIENTKKEIDSLNKSFEEIENQLDEISKKAERLAELEFKQQKGELFTVGEESEYSSLIFERLDKDEKELLDARYELEKQQDKLNAKLLKQQELLNNAKYKYDEITSKIEETSKSMSKIPINDLNKKLSTVVKKTAKWVLAVFGVRSAYLAIRQAMTILTNEDAQLKADIDFIKTALAYTLEPVVRGIVNLMKTLVQYIAYIIKAWTGRDIFASASKNLASANKSAKELQKTSASFDKFNTVGSKSTAGGGSGATAGLEMPTDEDMEGTWIGWIAKHKDLILATLAAIAAGLLTIKLIMLAINLANPLTWIALVVAAVVALAVLIALKWDEIKEMFAKFGEWIKDKVLTPIENFFKTIWEKIKTGFTNAITWIKEKFNGMIDFFKNIVKKITDVFKTIGEKGGQVVSNAFKAVINGVLKVIEGVINTPINGINKLLNKINKLPGVNLSKLNTITFPRLARGGIVYNPGAGVNMGNYIAGEGRNPEAVIPLDDATLDRLGQAIARHSQINATIVNEMDGRVLSKNLARVQSENNFARNGGY